jgi:LPXTG-motif cell wall-anchored protein
LSKLMLLVAMLTVAVVTSAPAAMAQQDDPQVAADATTKTATAGGPAGANAEADCKDGVIESKAGGVVAKAPCEPPPPPAPKAAPAPPPPTPAPKATPAPAPAPTSAPAPAPKAELPKTGGAVTASIFSLGAGALLVVGGLVARRMIKY